MLINLYRYKSFCVIPPMVVLTALLNTGCTTLSDTTAEKNDTPCDLAMQRMDRWSQAFIPPLPKQELILWRQLAQNVIEVCTPPATASERLDRFDAALALAYTVQQRYADALQQLQPITAETAPEALLIRASLVGQGLGGQPDQAQAAQLLERVAATGQAKFQIRVAQEFLLGNSVARDFKRAHTLIQAAIDQGSTEAAIFYAVNVLGLFQPNTQPAQLQEALAVLEQAATEQQSGDAMVELALYHLRRNNDIATAEKWADQALAAASDRAFEAKGNVALAKLSRTVSGRKLNDYSQMPDGIEAVEWFRKGVAVKDYHATAELGIMYVFGVGVQKDPLEARRWLEQARAEGSRKAAQALRQLRQAQQTPRKQAKPAS